jgi:hypothetical protein
MPYVRRLSPIHSTISKQKNNASTNGDGDTLQIESVNRTNAELRSNKAAKQRTNNTNDCCDDESIGSAAWHKKSSNRPGHKPEYDPRQNTHSFALFLSYTENIERTMKRVQLFKVVTFPLKTQSTLRFSAFEGLFETNKPGRVGKYAKTS